MVLQVSRGWRWLCGPRPFGRRLTENRGSVGLVAGEEPVPVANTEGAIEESVDDDLLPGAWPVSCLDEIDLCSETTRGIRLAPVIQKKETP